ncbi:MAG: hypothetical protein ACJAWN_002724 [Neolewinella sp.]
MLQAFGVNGFAFAEVGFAGLSYVVDVYFHWG